MLINVSFKSFWFHRYDLSVRLPLLREHSIYRVQFGLVSRFFIEAVITSVFVFDNREHLFYLFYIHIRIFCSSSSSSSSSSSICINSSSAVFFASSLMALHCDRVNAYDHASVFSWSYK